jgi:hypothetical protein
MESTMTDIPQFAVIPTNGRPCLKDCLYWIEGQVDEVILIEGGPDARMLSLDMEYPLIREPDLNISKWWNLGLALVESKVREWGGKQWNVAILNDDTIVPAGWMDAVSSAMREENAAAACSGGMATPYRVIHKEPGPVGLTTRMQGFGFVLAGEKGVRANEQLRWYFSDDHVDWMARRLGGMVMIPGFPVNHLYPNGQVTPQIQEVIAEDAALFHAFWGQRPW